jgi:predicted adenylyl cyclase CyaB
MQNIEIKAKYSNLSKAKLIAQEIGACFEGAQHQLDTYFNVKEGRLKLREIFSQESQLIFYVRPNETGVKLSEYVIYPVQNADHLKYILKSALGVKQIVEKQREIYLYEEIRIHLDQVKHLGNFLEFEGVISSSSDEDKVKAKVEMLVSFFHIPPSDFTAPSYSELMT